MRRISVWPAACMTLGLVLQANGGAARADDVTVVGPVTRIELAPDGKSATAQLKDNATGETKVVVVTDELTLDKFKDKRIVEGDEIRAKLEASEGTNRSKSFKKTAGC